MDSFVEILTLILGLYGVSIVYKRYSNKKSKLALYLILLYLPLALAPFSQFIDGLFYTGWGPDNTFGLYDVQYGYALVLIFISIANIGIILFSFEVFFTGGNQKLSKQTLLIRNFLTILAGSLGIIGGLLKLNDLDVTIIIGVYFVFMMVLYILIGQKAYSLASRISDADYKKAIRYIGHFAYCLLAIYIFFILDSFSNTYTIWGFFGWATYFLATYLGFIGFVLPMKKANLKTK